MMAFVERLINVQFTLGTGTFGTTGSNTVTISGLRISATLNIVAAPSMAQAQCRIFGMTLSQMNDLSAVTTQAFRLRKNVLTLSAGDATNGMSVVFIGIVTDAWADLNAAPDVAFNVFSQTGLDNALAPAVPTSYPGQVNAADVMQTLATQMGYGFQNNGVSVIMATPYFPGTPRDQVMRCAETAHIDWVIDKNVLAIWPQGSNRGAANVVISPETGMVGYPTYMSNGISLKTLYNPNIEICKTVQVKSQLDVASRDWIVQSVSHTLESNVPNGAWFTSLTGTTLNTPNGTAGQTP